MCLCKMNGPYWRCLHDTLLIVLNFQEDHPENRPKNRLIFTSKWTTAWHHGLRDASWNTHLQSFDSTNVVEEEQPSLEMPTSHGGLALSQGSPFWNVCVLHAIWDCCQAIAALWRPQTQALAQYGKVRKNKNASVLLCDLQHTSKLDLPIGHCHAHRYVV